MDSLSPQQRQTFQTHLNDLWDDYQDTLANLTLEAKQLAAGVAWDNFEDPLYALRREVFEEYARRAGQAANDYYDAVRSAWAEASGVKLPNYKQSQVSADRAFWQIMGGYNDTDFNGLTFTQVVNHQSHAGMTMDDLWALKTDGYGEDEWMNLAADIVGVTARLTSRFNMESDESHPRYARVPVGPTCAFCILMASRGFVYWSEESAGGWGNRYHKNDDCRIVCSWGETQLKGYDPDGMRERYLQTRQTIEGTLNRSTYAQYVAQMKAKGKTDTEIDDYDLWKTHRITQEMSKRDRQWLYDGTVPTPVMQSSRAEAELKPHERKTLDALSAAGFAVTVRERSDQQGVKTSDAVINGHDVDFKAPTGDTSNSVDQLLRSAARQGSAAVLHLQQGRTDMTVNQCLDYIRRALQRRKLDYVMLIDYDDKITRIDRDTKTASHSQSQ
ncbi:hypothetical protein BBIA_2154 [Bifidobacterium biavatii DSM 23969]|uniref:tRNA nuclease CdiA C-terminal domain-containing protein n=1 Tax=Bifidobacterium biavatii DSM 23969 TaxID=1437608 RepID=A0A086ZU21_9BIFI|nr:hypothetical protein BBIA_2154 [Bifidobacterium biavatii DSM 23969]